MFLSANPCPLRRNMRELNPGRPGLSRKRATMPLEVLLDTVEERTARRVIDPIFTVERDHAGTLVGFRGEGPAVGAALRESFIHIHTERVDDEARQAAVIQAIEQVLADVRVCVEDWRAMMTRTGEVIN